MLVFAYAINPSPPSLKTPRNVEGNLIVVGEECPAYVGEGKV